MASPPVWKLSAPEAMHWHHWDSGWLLYHDVSGQTHYLNELGSALLELLDEQPLDQPGLIEGLLGCYGELESDQSLQEAVARMLRTLDSLGLIEPCQS